nr:DUF6596 domain-containing protein [Brevundimonas variabilis]
MLDRTFREAGGRVIAALAASFRDLDLAEEAFAEACARAIERWGSAPPVDPAAWLYAVGRRWALDRLRRRITAAGYRPDVPAPPPTPEDQAMALDDPIPDERLRLIFVCCHPAMNAEARVALTLRTVCGLTTPQIAAAFLTPEPTLAQRLVRAKRKIAEAGVPFEVPGPDHWPERMDAVLSTLEIAYAQAHADAAGLGPNADLAVEVLGLTALLARLVSEDAEVQALAATVRFTEARRPARLAVDGTMIPLTLQDTTLWDTGLIAEADLYLARSAALSQASRTRPGPRALQAAIHGAHAGRRKTGVTPWAAILGIYNALLGLRDDPVIRTNRAVALAEVEGPESGLAALDLTPIPGWLPWHAARGDMLVRIGHDAEALHEFEAALALGPSAAEQRYLAACRDTSRSRLSPFSA